MKVVEELANHLFQFMYNTIPFQKSSHM